MLRERFNKSLLFKFLSIMTGIFLAGTLAISLVIAINEERTKEHSLTAMGKSFASYIAKLSADALIMKNNIQLDSVVADANNDDNIAYAIIYDEQGNPITTQYASINYRLPGVKAIVLSLPRNTALPYIIKAIKKKEPIIEVSSHINTGTIMTSTKSIGTVTIGMSEYNMRQAMGKTILFIIGFNIFIVILLGVVLFILSKKLIIDPIIKLAQASSLLAKGDLKAAVEIRTTGEVKTLVDSFNEMVRNLDKVTVSRDYVDNIIGSMINTLIVVSPDHKIMSVNSAACKLLEYEEKEIISRPVEMVFDEEKSDREARMTAMLADGYIDNIEVSHRTKNGRQVPVLLSGTVMRDKHQVFQGIIYVGQDITERKQAEEALRESEERYRTLVELAPDIIYRLDHEGRILFISPAVAQLGYQPEDLVGRKFEEIVYPEDRQRAPHTFVERRIGERAMKNLEIRLTTKEGDLRDYSLNYLTFSLFSRGVWNVPDDQIMVPEKEFIATQGIARDISDLKEAQEELREQGEILRRSEARFRALFETSRDALMTLAPLSGRFSSCNPATLVMFGARDEADFLSGGPWQYSPEWQPDGRDSAEKAKEMLETAMCEGSCFFEWTHARMDGTEFPATILLTRVELAGETILQATVRDITPQKRAEEALKKNSAFLNTLLNTIPTPVFFKDTEGRYLGFNKAFETYYGKTEEELVGKSVFDTAPKELAEIYHAKDAELYHNPGVQVYEAKMKDAHDQLHDVVYHKATFMNPDGKIGGLIGVILDITERKRVEEALAWQARVDAALAQLSAKLLAEVSVEEISALALEQAQQLTDSPCGFVGYIDPQTGYLVCPTLAPDILTGFQIRDGDILVKSFVGLWGWVLNQRRPLLTNTPDSDPRSTGVPQGHAPISRFLSVPALVGNELVGQVALANAPRDYEDQDLAVVKRLADLFALAIQRQRTELALQAASDAAKAANRAKSEFLSSMSHELRTPLNAIIGFSEVLQDQHFGALNEKQSRQIHHILSSGRHLLSLINDILDLAKVESGKMALELSPVHIAELIKSSLVMIKEKALKHHLQLQEDLAPELADLTIPADERKLKQIMFNLLSNAAKFTPDGGEIKVVAMREAGDLVVSVSDTGIGIAPEDQERIFGAFEQVDSSYTRQQEGTGLGLGLTRRMVELHGGRIWVESAGKDRGSSFSFTIPIGLMAKEAALPEKSV